MDFGKYKYEAAVKAREARKNQTNTVLKEIRFRLKIDTHDYETKRGHALRFLGAGDKVKAMIQFRGREQQRPEMGIRLLQRFADDVAEVGVVESSPRIDGRNMVMVVGPLKNKAEAKAEARRATQRAEAKAQNEAKATGVRIDVSGDDQAPLTQSLADLLPEGFVITTQPETGASAESEAPEAAPEAEAPVKEASVEEAPVKEAAVQEAPKQEAAVQEAPKQEAPVKAAPVKEAAVQEAPKQAAPKAAAPKREAPKAAPAPVKAPAAAKPAEAAAPAPAAPRPPVPMPKPIARPAAPKPAARPAPKAASKPAAKKTT
jgi:translation initiation factor IF-3